MMEDPTDADLPMVRRPSCDRGDDGYNPGVRRQVRSPSICGPYAIAAAESDWSPRIPSSSPTKIRLHGPEEGPPVAPDGFPFDVVTSAQERRKRANKKRFNSNSVAFIEYRGGRLRMNVLVISSDEETRGALVQVLQLLGCERAFESDSLSQLQELVSLKVTFIICDLEFATDVIKHLGSQSKVDEKAQEENAGAGAGNTEDVTVKAAALNKDAPLFNGDTPVKKKQKDANLSGDMATPSKNIPVVCLCGKRYDRSRLAAVMELGASGFICKPFRIQAIRATLMRYNPGSLPTQAEQIDPGENGNYERLDEIGRGAFGEVYLVKRQADGACFAQKEIKVNKLDFHNQRRVLTELALHKSFDCPFIVRSYSSWVRGDTAFLLLEYIKAGALSALIKLHKEKQTQIPDDDIITWCGQIVIGLLYLHQKDVIHRDLKLENILGPDEIGCVKLADFGISRNLAPERKEMSMVGTPFNCAPERLGVGIGEEGPYGVESDYWALGVCLYELVTFEHPFVQRAANQPAKEDTSPRTPYSVRQGLFSQITEGQLRPLPYSRASVLHRVVVGGLLQKNAQERPTGHQILDIAEIGKALGKSLAAAGLSRHPAVLEVVTLRFGCAGNTRVANQSEDVIQLLRKGDTKALEESISAHAIPLNEINNEFDLPRPTWNTNDSMIGEPRSDLPPQDPWATQLQKKVQTEQAHSATVRKLLEDAHMEHDEFTGAILDFLGGDSCYLVSGRFIDRRTEALYLRSTTSNFWCSRFLLAMFLWATHSAAILMHKFQDPSKWFVDTTDLFGPVIILLQFLLFLGLACTYSVLCGGVPARQDVNVRDWLSFTKELLSTSIIIFSVVLFFWAISETAHKMDADLITVFYLSVAFPSFTLSLILLPRLLPVRSFQLFLPHLCFIASPVVMRTSIGFDGFPSVLVSIFSFLVFSTSVLLERRTVERGCRLDLMLRDRIHKRSKDLTNDVFHNLEWKSRDWNLGGTTASVHRKAYDPLEKAPIEPSPRLTRANSGASTFSKASRSNSLLSIRSPKTSRWKNRSHTQDSHDLFAGACDEQEIQRIESFNEIKKAGTRESWLIDPRRVQIEEVCLGTGAFGSVHQGKFYGTAIALKLSKNEGDGNGEGNCSMENLSNELRVLRHVWHPNIVRFYGSCLDSGTTGMVIVLECLQGQNLEAFVCSTDQQVTTKMRHQLLMDIASALQYLHGLKPCIVHGDLKGSNIFVEKWFYGPRAILLDFGLSQLITRRTKKFGGTVHWMAPEVIRGGVGAPAASAADVFSFGRIAYMVVVGLKPLADHEAEEIIAHVKSLIVTPLKWPRNISRLPLGVDCHTLSERCLSLGALMRPGIDEVYARLESWNVPGEMSVSERDKSEGLTPLHVAQITIRQHRKNYSEFWSLFTGRSSINMARSRNLLSEIKLAASHRHRLISPMRLLLSPERILGVGDFGFVVAGRLDGTQVVVRVPRVRLKMTTASHGLSLLAILKDLMLIKHPCIVAVHGLCVDEEEGIVNPVLEWVEGVPLDQFVRNASWGMGRIPAVTRQHLLSGISSALFCLHDHNPPITHGDLKGSNIMVESRSEGVPRCKLLDFGWSRVLAKEAGGTRGNFRQLSSQIEKDASLDSDLGSSPMGLGRSMTLLMKSMRWRLTNDRRRTVWSAPEVLALTRKRRHDPLEPSADVFSFGRLCYLVVVGRQPLHGMDLVTIESYLKRGAVPPLEWPDAWPVMSKRIAEDIVAASLVGRARPIVEWCCSINPQLRPNIDDVLNDISTWINPVPRPKAEEYPSWQTAETSN